MIFSGMTRSCEIQCGEPRPRSLIPFDANAFEFVDLNDLRHHRMMIRIGRTDHVVK